MQKLLVLLFIVFVSIFALGSALAADLEISDVTSITAAPTGTATGSFVLSNNNLNLSVTSITCSASIEVEDWTTSCSCPSEIAYNSSKTASFSVTIPQYTSPGTYSGSINVNGILNNVTIEDSASFKVDVSAVPNIEITWLKGPSNLYQGESQVIEFNVTNTGNLPLPLDTEINVTSTPEIVSYSSSALLWPRASEKVSLTVDALSSTRVGTHTLKVSVLGKNDVADITKESERNFYVFYRYCAVREGGYITLQSIMNDDDIEGEEFEPLDSFEIEVKVRNNDNEKRYAIVEAVILYDSDEIDETEVKEKVKIDDYDSEKVILTMKIPADVEEGYHYLYVKVYDDDDRDNCQQREIRFRVDKESYLVLPYSVAIEPTKANCGQTFKVSGRLANIGSHDEDKVKVAYEDDFGNPRSKVFNDLDEGSLSSLFSFASEVPKDADEGSHTITLYVYYDYDDVDGYYGESEEYEYYLTVEGNCYKPEEIKVSLTTQLVELIGNKVNVFISVKNTGNVNTTYTVDATCDWAVIDSISQPELMIEPDQSKNIIIELTPKKGTELGIHYLEVGVSADGTRETKSIPVNVQKLPSTWRQKFESLVSKAKEQWVWLTIDAILLLIIVVLVVYFIIRPKMPKLLQRQREIKQ